MRRISTVVRALAVVVLAVAAACSSSRSQESVGSTAQAVTSPTTARVLSFEQPTTDWTGTNVTIRQGNQFTDGAHSAAVSVTASGGRLTSIPLSSLGPISSTVALQVRLPAYVVSQSWQGQVALWLDSPTAGVWGQYIGPIEFKGAQTGAFHQIEIGLPASIVTALSTKTYNDLKVSIELDFPPSPNASLAASDPFYLDQLSFGIGPDQSGQGGATGAGGAGHTGGSSTVGNGGAGVGVGATDFSRIFSFETPTTDWTASDLNLALGAEHFDGAHSAMFTVGHSGGRLTSVPLISLGTITDTVTAYVWLPAYLADRDWQGQVALWLNSPTAGVWDQYYGPSQFKKAPTGVFQQIQFTLPSAVVTALSTKTYSDLTVALEFDFDPKPNGDPNFSDPFYLDRIDFGQMDISKPPPWTTLPTDADAILPSTTDSSGSAAGRIPGSSSVDASGAFDYRVPLDVPIGRNGIEPHLALKYSSSASNGVFGVGWNLEGTSSISRCRKFTARDGVADSIKVKLKRNDCSGYDCQEQFQKYNSDLDNFCLDGEQLVRVAGSDTAPEFRTERDALSKVVASYDGQNWPSSFTVWRRDGTITRYTAGPVTTGVALRNTITGGPNGDTFSGVLAWPIDTVQDRFGNAMSYQYAGGDDGSAAQILDNITYTGCVSGSPCPYGAKPTRRIQFYYEARNDYLSHWVAGLNAGVGVRANRIAMFTLDSEEQTLVRAYNFAYDESGATGRSRLTSVSLCDARGACMPPTTFEWGGGKGTDYRRSWHVLGPDNAGAVAAGQCTVGNAPPGCFWATYEPTRVIASPEVGDPFLVGDFDGNGTDDILVYSGDLSPIQDPDHSPSVSVKFSHPSNGTATFDEVRIKGNRLGDKADGPDYRGARAVDIDQDGQTELLVADAHIVPGDGHANVLTQDYIVYRWSVVAKDFAPVLRSDGTQLTLPTPSNFTPNGSPTLLDVTGDGVLDYYYDTNGLQSDGHGHAFSISRAIPGATSLLPDAYTTPLPLSYQPTSAQQAVYDKGLCRLLPVDFAGHGYRAPGVICDDADTNTYFADFNGDGLADILKINHSAQASASVRLSTGVELAGDFAHQGLLGVGPEAQALPSQVVAGTDFAGLPHIDNSRDAFSDQVVDINGDGLADVVQFQTPTNSQAPAIWLTKNLGREPAFDKIQLPYTQSRSGGVTQKVADFNGDGLPDIVQGVGFFLDPNNAVSLQFFIQDSSNNDDIITKVSTDGIELAKLTYKAATTAELGPGAQTGTAQGVFRPRRGLTVVSEATLVEGTTRSAYGYSYIDPAADTSGRGFLGYRAIIKADPQRAARTTTIYENTRIEGTLHGYHLYPYAFVPEVIETNTGRTALSDFEGPIPTGHPAPSLLVDRSIISTSLHRLHLLNTPGGVLTTGSTFFIESYNATLDKRDQSGSTFYLSSRQQTHDDFANITSSTTTDGSETTTDTISYFNDSSAAWLIARPHVHGSTRARSDRVGTAQGQTSAAATQTFVYGDHGELKQITSVSANGVESQTVTTLGRDDSGLLRHVVSNDIFGNTRASSFDYSSDGVYRQHTQDALGHDTWNGYHPGLGVPLISYDANGNRAVYQYDGFGRVRTTSPTRAPVTTTTYAQTAGELRVTTTQVPGTSTAKQYNALSQLAATTTNVGGRSSFILYSYTPLGQLEIRTVPVFLDDTSQAPDAIYTYDNLNEVRTVTKGDGSTVTVNILDPFTTEIVATGDKARHTVVRTTNDGLVSSVRENATTGAVPTRGVDYVYGQGQELDQVIELGGPTTTYLYRGSPTPLTTLSSEAGETNIQYDGFGNPRHVQHNPQFPSTIDYQYDSLGRPTFIKNADPDPTSPGALTHGETHYIYDSGIGAAGRLSYASSPDGAVTRHSFTPEGLPLEDELDFGGHSYLTDYGFDEHGRISHVDYPDPQNGLPRVALALAYNDTAGFGAPDGSLQKVTRGTANYWTTLQRNATGVAEDALLVGNLAQSLAIDPVTLRITGVQVNLSRSMIYDVQYGYYAGGNVSSRTDSLAGTQAQYTYDEFDQLSSWSSVSNAGSSTEAYTYDPLGNQTASGASTSVFGGDSFSPHQIASRTKGSETRSFKYDALGRQASMRINGVEVRKIAYTFFDLPHAINTELPSSKKTTYAYDASQQKVHETDGTTDTTYVGNLYERRVNNKTCKIDDVFYTFAEGQRVAQIVQQHDVPSCNGSTSHPGPATEVVSALHSDVQGSVTASTPMNSFSTARQTFSPWGERLPLSTGAQSSSIDQVTVGFTDQEHDDTVGLVNMRGRMYDSTTRTFLTPDPVVGKPLKVSGWNKYAYVLNNPLKYVDPSGFEGEEGVILMDPLWITPDPSVDATPEPSVWQDTPDDDVAPTTSKSFDAESCSDDSCLGATITASNSNQTAEDQDWDAAKAGLWNAYIGEVQNAFSLINPISTLSGGGLDLSFLKATPPPGVREREQYEFANTGATVLVGALGVLAGDEAPAETALVDLAGAAAEGAGETITLYHGSIDSFSTIAREGLDAARTPTWVTSDLAAAENAIGPGRVLSAGQGLDKGIITSVVPRSAFEALQGSGAISGLRAWPGFGGGQALGEYVLRGPGAIDLFNAGIR